MALTDLNLQGSYKNYSSLLETKFFIPVLSEAKIYLRVASYSPGSSIMELIPGLSSMINNGVEMKVVITIHLPEHDYDANNIILDVLMEVGSIPEIQCNDPTKTFYKLLSAGNIDIKFMICKKVITPENFGIVDDHDHNSVSYSFLPNETNEEGEINREEIRVSRSWINEENCYVQDYYSKFYSYWEGNFSSKDLILYDVPEVIKQKVGSALEGKGKIVAKSKIKLRSYQEKAVKYFTDMNFKAILEMATGTGKTFIALNCAKALYEKEGERFTIIVVPTENLMYQWKNEWKGFFGVVPYLYKKEKSLSFLRYHNLYNENGVVIITYNSLSKIVSESNFLSIIGEGNLIIADEVHWMGAPKFSRAMLNNFQWRLGLSATPERMFDEEGTNMVLDYFEKNEFKYPLQDAIVDGYLSPFSYFPYFCKLSQEELSEYENLTKKTLYFKKGSNEDKPSPLENLLFKRAKVAKKAICKNSIFDKIIESLYNSKKLDHLLIFFEDSEQLSHAQKSLMELKVPFNIIDASTSESDRNLYIERLKKTEIFCLLSMRVMDEGIDIPSATRELIMASSSNQRQYIQRAGRILRMDMGKENAEIYDIITYSEKNECPEWLWKYELKAIKREIQRAMYFSIVATNQSWCIDSMYNFAKKFNISIWE